METLPVPLQVGHLSFPVLYEKSAILYSSVSLAYSRRRSSRTLEYVATVLLTFLPIGTLSINSIFLMPSQSISRTSSGNSSPLICDFTAGYNASKSNVVLPLPDTPVTAVSFPFGISMSNGLTLWISEVLMEMLPFSNVSPDLSLMIIFSEFVKNGAICEFELFSISSRLPCAMMFPPSAPACGPISII